MSPELEVALISSREESEKARGRKIEVSGGYLPRELLPHRLRYILLLSRALGRGDKGRRLTRSMAYHPPNISRGSLFEGRFYLLTRDSALSGLNLYWPKAYLS